MTIWNANIGNMGNQEVNSYQRHSTNWMEYYRILVKSFRDDCSGHQCKHRQRKSIALTLKSLYFNRGFSCPFGAAFGRLFLWHNEGTMTSLVEERFISDTLKEAAAFVYKDQTAAIQRAVSSNSTGRLLRDRFFNVTDTSIEHHHPVYERFLDMKQLHRNGKAIKRTPLHIHNRFMWGLYLRIQDRLMYGLTEEVRGEIRMSLGIDDLKK